MKKILALIIAAAMVFCLAACGEKKENVNENNENIEFSESFNIGFLKGPTGIGAAYLMGQAEEDKLDINYNFTLEADASVIVSALVSGELDVGAVPTNVASTLYNKTKGEIKIIAINTLGVLHILEKGDTVKEIKDLKGKTLYATGQGSNPEYVLNYILRENGIEPGKDITIEYLASDELQTKMAAGEIDLCMLPVPAATAVLAKNADVRDVFDLTDEWGKVSESQLTQGCIVARTGKFSDAELKVFLGDYAASIEYMSNEANVDDAAALTVKYGIVGAEPIAKKAIPQAGLTFITGSENMKKALADYFQVLFDADPSSIGGALPADDIYYEVK